MLAAVFLRRLAPTPYLAFHSLNFPLFMAHSMGYIINL